MDPKPRFCQQGSKDAVRVPLHRMSQVNKAIAGRFCMLQRQARIVQTLQREDFPIHQRPEDPQ